MHHKSHSPKAHSNSLHPPVTLYISPPPPNISLSSTFLNSIYKPPYNIPLNKHYCTVAVPNTAVQLEYQN
jgi:hypothetical protein